ncbi:hypothetical protein ACLIR7_16285 [Nitratireductor aquimarinus]|uniref:hypothetical protein n=1 Tax=Nitratireductor aquimarinus TaxID=889300 RepID=UPI00398F04BD
MIRPWAYLDPQDREASRTVIAFLAKRLAEQGTIDWALKLQPGQRIERIAIEHVLAGPNARDLAEPWASAWRLIEESWAVPHSDGHDGTANYGIQKRLRAGDRSGAVVAAIVDLVAPWLKVEPLDAWRWNYIKKPRKPKAVEHILSARLTSGKLIDLNVLELAKLDDIAFLISLAGALEAAVSRGLDIARRLGWDESRSFLGLGLLNRVFYTQPKARGGNGEPDAYHRGIAPSVKLLHAVVARIAEIQPAAAQSFVRRWQAEGSSLFVRLWSAMARSSELVTVDVVTSLLKSLDDQRFWDLHMFPEIAELRAVRFSEFDHSSQNQITNRLRKGPPRNHWPSKADGAKVADARLYWAVRELRRIEIAGGALPARAKNWLASRQAQFDDLAQMTIDAGFPEGAAARYVHPNPDNQYDDLQGVARLQMLEAALAAGRGGWNDDPAERANDWINQQGSAEKVLADFEATNNGGDYFPKVWNRFGWAHKPRQRDGQVAQDAEVGEEAGRVLGLLNRLSEATLSSAIEGICAWLSVWERRAVKLPLFLPVWLRLWPTAVEVTNGRPENTEDEDLSITARTEGDDREPMQLDTLNTPAGRLVGVFLAACPDLRSGARAFSAGSMETQMRDIVIATDGRSGLIAKHRMIEALPYFLFADSEWAKENLIAPLLKDDGDALALWQAVARRTQFTEVLESIGAAMVERANDRRLGRETRRQLVFSLVIETLHAFHEGRAPAVPNQRIQQMLRTLDDEVRASAATVIQQFVQELSAKVATGTPTNGEEQEGPVAAAVLFRSSAAPFLREVWPQERSLATPGVSSALADLPATSGEAFAEAVDIVARFMVPFDCWSMLNYGLYGDRSKGADLAAINDAAKAKALLKLLDLTVGTSEGAAIPHDLTDALDQILKVDPALSTSAVFRRLATAARR